MARIMFWLKLPCESKFCSNTAQYVVFTPMVKNTPFSIVRRWKVMYGTTILATLLSIVLIGIINPAIGMMMIATSVFGTLVFFRVQSFSHIPRVETVPRVLNLRRRNPYSEFFTLSTSEKSIFSRNNPYRDAVTY